jgi:hypothetical protein
LLGDTLSERERFKLFCCCSFLDEASTLMPLARLLAALDRPLAVRGVMPLPFERALLALEGPSLRRAEEGLLFRDDAMEGGITLLLSSRRVTRAEGAFDEDGAVLLPPSGEMGPLLELRGENCCDC